MPGENTYIDNKEDNRLKSNRLLALRVRDR